MTKKYIVKNCPCLSMAEYPNGKIEDDLCGLTVIKYCQDCTDCLIKQVVEKCKFRSKICKDCGSDVCFECEHLTGGILADEILQLFTIEEAE